MNDKLSSYHEAIFYRHRQRYTSEMIQLWLHETHKLSVDTSSIDRSIHKSMKTTSSFERISPDNEYSYYRSTIVARRQARNYKSKLSRYSGIIHNRQNLGLNGIQLYESLLCDGITTSLSSVYRELRNINEKKRLQERKN